MPALALAGLPRAAAAWSAVLLGTFSAELVRVRLRDGGRVPCGCFGGRASVGIGPAVLRNAAVGAIAGFVWTSGKNVRAPAWPALPRAGDALPMILVFGSVVAATLATWRVSVWIARGNRA